MLVKTVLKKFALSILLLAGTAAGAEGQSYIARSQFYGVENGLSHREVNAIYQDKQGFMWFGTRYGLNRFDGYGFNWHTQERDSLPFNDVESIAEDGDGYLWLVGPSSQPSICLYHPLNKEVKTFKEKFGQDLKPHGHNPRGILKTAPDGAIYFLADAPLRLMSYHASKGLKSVALPSNWTHVGLAEVSKNGTVWSVVNDSILVEIDTTGKLLQRYVHTGRIQLRMGGPQNGVLFYYNTGPVTGGSDRMYFIDEYGSRTEIPIETLEQDRTFFPELVFKFDPTGLMWAHDRLLSAGGTVLVDVGSQFPELSAIGIRAFYRDKSGALWLGGNFGMYRIQVRDNRFNTLLQSTRNASLVEGNACRGIFVDENYLYVNQQDEGLFRVTRVGNEKKLLYKNMQDWGHLALYNSKNGQYLYVGSSGKVMRYDKNSGDTLTLKFPTALSIWSMYQPNTNQMLVGGKNGLYTVDLNNNIVDAFNQYNQFGELADAHVLHMNTDNQGQVWICASSGLYAWDATKGITARYWSGGQGAFYLPADEFQHFYHDEDGTYWFGTAFTGLLHWDKKKNTVKKYTRVDGLSNNNIYAVYPDGLNNLWLPSDNGLMQFNRKDSTTITYLVRDGIAHNEFNRLSHFKGEDGRMYFGGLNGITTFHPGSFTRKEKTSYHPPLRIASFQQFKGNTDKLEDRTALLMANEEIVVYPGDRFLVFELALLTFEDQNQTQYAYKLEGVDKEWNHQNERILRLSGLPSGLHNLRIRGQSADGTWSEELVVPICVLLPVIYRPWFLVLMGLLLVGSIYGVFRLRKRQHKLEQLTMAREIARVTAKLELDKQTIESQAEELRHLDSLKSRFFANVSHELRTPLTLMLSPLNTVLKNKKLDDPSRKLLNLASENGEQLLRLLAEILDLSKLESGKLELSEKPVGLQTILRKQVAQFEALAQRLNIDLQYDYQAKDPLVVLLDVKNTERILNNLLSNAMKFTPAGGSVRVQVVELKKGLEIRVKDTGRGIHPDDLPYIFDRYYQSKRPDAATEGGTGIGLALSFELARMFGGSLRVESKLGNGSTFYFSFPKKEVVVGYDEMVETTLPEPFENVQLIKDATAEVSTSKPRLLVVEDHDSLLQYLTTLLSPDFDVVGVRHGKEALGVLERGEHGVDLILSDIMMPVMDGFQLLEHLKNHDAYRHLPVVMLTARADWTDKLHALRLGVDDYLIKPFREEELRARIDNLLRNVMHRKPTVQTSDGEQPLRPLISAEEQRWLEELEKMVQDNLSDTHFNVDQLSDLLFISRRQLNRRLQQLIGLTPVQYIREARLSHARRLLENRTYSTVKSVVLASGMTDTEHFAKLFREKFGRAPSDYAEPTPGDARNE